jgi:hypothetical protein
MLFTGHGIRQSRFLIELVTLVLILSMYLSMVVCLIRFYLREKHENLIGFFKFYNVLIPNLILMTTISTGS